MSSTELIDEDTRTVREYLEDISEVERKGLYPGYSRRRRFIITYWENAIKKNLVSPDDKLSEAIRKIRQAKG